MSNIMIMNQALVSIIIPVYNSSEILAECLYSVFGQTYKNLEIICVDDASDDSSMEILKSMKKNDKRIRIVQRGVNGGLPAARNSGIEVATGDYIYFLDADDLLFNEDAIALLVSRAKEFSCDVVIGGTIKYFEKLQLCFIDNHKLYLERNRLVESIPQFPQVLCSIVSWNKLYRKSFLDYNGITFFHEECTRFEDNCYTPKALFLSGSTYIEVYPTYIFRQPSPDLDYFNEKVFPQFRYKIIAIDKMIDFFNENMELEYCRHLFEKNYGSELLMGAVRIPRECIDTKWLYSCLSSFGEVIDKLPQNSYALLHKEILEMHPLIKMRKFEKAWEQLQKSKGWKKEKENMFLLSPNKMRYGGLNKIHPNHPMFKEDANFTYAKSLMNHLSN